MAIVYNDMLESRIETTAGGLARATRVAIVSDISVSGDPDPNVLLKAIHAAGMPQIGEPHPSDPACQVARHVVTGLSNSMCRVEVIYERISEVGSWGGSGEEPKKISYILTEDTSVEMVATNMVWTRNGRKPIYVSSKKYPHLGRDLLTIQVADPVRRLIARGVFRDRILGRPNPSADEISLLEHIRGWVGCVNEKKWRGFKRGQCRFDGFQTETTDGGQTYYFTLLFTGKTGASDWREFGVLYNSQTGKYIDIDEDAVENARWNPYVNDIIEYDGFTVVGPYPTHDFEQLFGF
jgi:hypothetical protein